MPGPAADNPDPGLPCVTAPGEGAPVVTEDRDTGTKPVVKGSAFGLLVEGCERPRRPVTSEQRQVTERSGFTTWGMVERLGGQLDRLGWTRGARPAVVARIEGDAWRGGRERAMSRAPRRLNVAPTAPGGESRCTGR